MSTRFALLGDARATVYGGTSYVNHAVGSVLKKHFETEGAAQKDDAIFCFSEWTHATGRRRCFLDHGSFADGSYWAWIAPQLRTDDAIIVSSRVCEQVADRMLESPRPAIHLVPYFADTDVFVPADDRDLRRRQLGARLGLSPEVPWLLAVSSFDRRKNIHLAVRFLRALDTHVPGTVLLILGSRSEGPGREEYAGAVEQGASSLGVEERVRFLDPMPHESLSRLMAASDLLVHFSNCRLENFGLVVAEALASGLPIVAADWGGLRDLVEHGRTGFLAPTYLSDQGPRTVWPDVVAPAAELLLNRERWAAFSRSAREYAVLRLAPNVFETRLVRALTEISAPRPHVRAAVRRTRAAEDLAFAVYRSQIRGGPRRSTGAEFRELISLDGGAHYRQLAGFAASQESPPVLDPRSPVFAIVPVRIEGTDLVVTDAAWPTRIPMPAPDDPLRALVQHATNRFAAPFSIRDVSGDPEALISAAQQLVDWGVFAQPGVPLRST